MVHPNGKNQGRGRRLQLYLTVMTAAAALQTWQRQPHQCRVPPQCDDVITVADALGGGRGRGLGTAITCIDGPVGVQMHCGCVAVLISASKLSSPMRQCDGHSFTRVSGCMRVLVLPCHNTLLKSYMKLCAPAASVLLWR